MTELQRYQFGFALLAGRSVKVAMEVAGVTRKELIHEMAADRQYREAMQRCENIGRVDNPVRRTFKRLEEAVN